MIFPRFSLGVTGLLFVGLGLAFLLDPQRMADVIGMRADRPRHVVELRAMYGGFELGLGIFFLIAIGRTRWIRAALAAQKAKVQALNGARDEFSVLTNEMENARRAYEMAGTRFNQTSLEGQSKQTDIAVLTAATAPLEPAGPRVVLNTLLSVVVGAIIGFGIVLILELLDQRVRSALHLTEAFGLPVLGVIQKPRALSRKAKAAKPLPGAGSTALQA